MSARLILDSLEIKNFRGLHDVAIKKLGRANLIVGRNNVGKTSVIEALRLYARPGDPDVLIDLLQLRDEIDPSILRERQPRAGGGMIAYSTAPFPDESLFYGRPASPGATSPIWIGPVGHAEQTLSIEPIEHEDDGDYSLTLIFKRGEASHGIPLDDAAAIQRPNNRRRAHSNELAKKNINCLYIDPSGLAASELAALWDDTALTPNEQDVISSLKLLAPSAAALHFRHNESPDRPVPFVRLDGEATPVPLRSLGDGISRALGIVLALVNAKGGFLLVDEIENGIHYAVQTDLWRLIFRVASRLDVQVFATTHSSDCIIAFQAAAAENTQEEGVLIRLARRGDCITASEFDEREMTIAVEGEMELR